MPRFVTFALALVLLFTVIGYCAADSLQIDTTPVWTKKGEPVVITVSMKNSLVPRPPVTIIGSAEWVDEYGTTQTTTTSTAVMVVQPIKVNKYRLVMPALFAFVADSGRIDGQPTTVIVGEDSIIFEINRTLNEGESVVIEYAVKTL